MITNKLQFLLGKRTMAFTFWPFIVIRKGYENNKEIIDHERIHLKQQVELLLIVFYLWYFTELIIKFFKYKNMNDAYFNSSFEREAYFHEHEPDYLKTRKLYSFLKYI